MLLLFTLLTCTLLPGITETSYLRSKKTASFERDLKHNLDPTPPGYEDFIWCPQGTCSKLITGYDFGAAGPSRFFHECYSKDLDLFVVEAWTGSAIDLEPPPGWITEPKLKQCPGSVKWKDLIKDEDKTFGTFRIASDMTSSGNARSVKDKWCWDIKGGTKAGAKLITKKCDDDSTKQNFLFRIVKKHLQPWPSGGYDPSST